MKSMERDTQLETHLICLVGIRATIFTASLMVSTTFKVYFSSFIISPPFLFCYSANVDLLFTICSDESEEGDRKRQKTEDPSRSLISKLIQQPLRSTHPLDMPFASHQYHQYQPPQLRGPPSNNNSNNSIKKLGPSANSPLLQAKAEKPEQPPAPSGQKKQPSEVS